jgi:type III restriction enzyme
VNRDIETSSARELFDTIADRGRLMVLNDEAHHVHDEKLKWSQTIERLHSELRKRTPDDSGAGAVSKLDYSATPKYEKGGAFRHVVIDYPLAQAVADGIVKTPLSAR